MTQARAPKTTTVLADRDQRRAERARLARRSRGRRGRAAARPSGRVGACPDRRRPTTPAGSESAATAGGPGAFALSASHSWVIWSSRPSAWSARDRLVDARGQRAVLGQDQAEVLLRRRSSARELADDDAVLDLDGGDEERRRQVDDEAVDLLVLERLDRRVVRVVDARLLGRLDDARRSCRSSSSRPGRRTGSRPRSAIVVAPAIGVPPTATSDWFRK